MVADGDGVAQAALENYLAGLHDLGGYRLCIDKLDTELCGLIRIPARAAAALKRLLLHRFVNKVERKLAGRADIVAAEALVAQACAYFDGMIAQVCPPRHRHEICSARIVNRRQQGERCRARHFLSLSDSELFHHYTSV